MKASITLRRYAWVADFAVQRLTQGKIDADFKHDHQVATGERIPTEDTKDVEVEGVYADARGRNPYVAVWFDGLVSFRLSHGWGEKSVRDWCVDSTSLSELRAMATQQGFKVKTQGQRKKRRSTRRPKTLPKEQVPLFNE